MKKNDDEKKEIFNRIRDAGIVGLLILGLLLKNDINELNSLFNNNNKEKINENLEDVIDSMPEEVYENITDENIENMENTIGIFVNGIDELNKKIEILGNQNFEELRKAMGIPDDVAEDNISIEAYATALQYKKKYWLFTSKDDNNIQAIQCNMFGNQLDPNKEKTMVKIPANKLFAGIERGDYYLIKYDYRNDRYALISKDDVDINIANTYKTKKDVKINTSAFGEQTLKKGTEIKVIGNEAIYFIDGQEFQVEAKEIKDQINKKNSEALNKQPIYIYAKGFSEYYKKGDSKNRMLGSEVQYDINTNKKYVTTYSINGFGINIETKDLIETGSSKSFQDEIDKVSGYQGGSNNTNSFTPSQMEKNARHTYVEEATSHKGETNDDERFTKYLGMSSSVKDEYCAAYIMYNAKQSGVPEYVIPQGAKYASCAVMYKWYKDQGLIVENDGSYIPQEGDLVFFDSDGNPNDKIDHVGVVTYSKDGKFSTVEGNNADGKVAEYDLNYKIGDNNVDNSGKMKPLWFAKVPWDKMVPEQQTSQTQTTIKGEITADDVDIGVGFDSEQSKNAQDVANSLMQKNIDLIHLAGIWANIYHESSFHIAAQSSDGYNSIGYCQWTGGRKTKLLEYPKIYNENHGTNYDWKNTLVQMDYLLYGDPDTYGDKRTIEAYLETVPKDAREAAMWFCEHWERPAYIDPNRGETAQKFYNNIIKNHQNSISFNNKKQITDYDWNNFLQQVNKLLCRAEDVQINEEKERFYGQIMDEHKKRLAFRDEGR